jgi:hypothetical protein
MDHSPDRSMTQERRNRSYLRVEIAGVRLVKWSCATLCVILCAFWISSLFYFRTFGDLASPVASIHGGKLILRMQDRPQNLSFSRDLFETWEEPAFPDFGWPRRLYWTDTTAGRRGMDVTIPLWLPIMVFAFFGSAFWLVDRRVGLLRRRYRNNHCLICGYDLRLIDAVRCPECGMPTPPTSSLPLKHLWIRPLVWFLCGLVVGSLSPWLPLLTIDRPPESAAHRIINTVLYPVLWPPKYFDSSGDQFWPQPANALLYGVVFALFSVLITVLRPNWKGKRPPASEEPD